MAEVGTPAGVGSLPSLGRIRRMVIAGEQELDGNQQRWIDFNKRGGVGCGGPSRHGWGGGGARHHPYSR